MRLLLSLLILLVFPVAELLLLIALGQRYGWGLLGYLLFMILAGWLLIQDERIAVFGRLAQTLKQGDHPLLALLTSAKKFCAGVLFILPGVLSDVLGLVILLLPLQWLRLPKPQTGDDHVIEGEWRRDDQDLLK